MLWKIVLNFKVLCNIIKRDGGITRDRPISVSWFLMINYLYHYNLEVENISNDLQNPCRLKHSFVSKIMELIGWFFISLSVVQAVKNIFVKRVKCYQLISCFHRLPYNGVITNLIDFYRLQHLIGSFVKNKHLYIYNIFKLNI